MKKYNRLPDEQLIKRLREGENEIMDYIINKYKSMVRKKAKAMYLLGGENDDLIQEGMIGLFKAVRDYDVNQENSFQSVYVYITKKRQRNSKKKMRTLTM